MTRDIVVRRATIEDEDIVLDLWSELSAHYESLRPHLPAKWQGPSSRERRKQRLATLWTNPEYAVGYLAETDAIKAGFCRAELSLDGPADASIHTLFVRREYRGSGVGKALMSAAIEWCKAQGAKEVTLDVLPANVEAASFHESLGFVPFLTSYIKTL